MTKFCADCIYMGNVDTKGKFPCNNSRSGLKVVSARQVACNYFTECFNSRRSETERERMMRTSRDYGYYIMTAVMDILNLPERETYITEFAYVKDVIMPKLNGGAAWVNEYDTFGPVIAFGIREENDPASVALELFETYIRTFHALFNNNEIDQAISVYQDMFRELMVRYQLIDKPQKREIKN
ncbi:MAG: hypothetical protein OSJ65_04165 [Bacilli bacterium]|nr:hypothetical protein [Bacilli bacterium]